MVFRRIWDRAPFVLRVVYLFHAISFIGTCAVAVGLMSVGFLLFSGASTRISLADAGLSLCGMIGISLAAGFAGITSCALWTWVYRMVTGRRTVCGCVDVMFDDIPGSLTGCLWYGAVFSGCGAMKVAEFMPKAVSGLSRFASALVFAGLGLAVLVSVMILLPMLALGWVLAENMLRYMENGG